VVFFCTPSHCSRWAFSRQWNVDITLAGKLFQIHGLTTGKAWWAIAVRLTGGTRVNYWVNYYGKLLG